MRNGCERFGLGRLALLLAVLCGVSGLAPGQTDSVFKNVFWQPNELRQGSVMFVTVELDRRVTRVSGTLAGRELAFFRTEKPNVWYSLAGVDLETAPGSYDLNLRATAGKRILRSSKKVDVAAGEFKTGNVEVPEAFVTPDESGKKQIAEDQRWKSQAYAHSSMEPQWSGDFIKPVAAPMTESFGMSRLLNEEMTSLHRGTDFPVKEGTPVVASNAGTVVLAREMFYEGNCVIVDHGQHLTTIYMHLSKIEVKVGQHVKKEQTLGLSGATGRVTGPHVHMGVRWSGAYLDPTKLVSLTLPETKAKVSQEAGRKTAHRGRHRRR